MKHTKNGFRRLAVKYAMITLGSALYAAGISMFLDPNRLAPGGVSGMAIIINKLIPAVPTGTWIIIMNIPILLAGMWKLGARFLVSTVYSVAVSSVFMNLLDKWVGALTYEPILACAAGAFLAATGIGIVFRNGATTGGTDVIVKLLRTKFPYISTGGVFLITDGIIVAASGFVFGDIDKALFAGIAVFLHMYILNTVLYGSDEARIVYIISSRDKDIAARLMNELDAGATYLSGTGAYTGDRKNVLMCALRMRSLPQARDIVREEDGDAFMIVTKATGVFGEGFKSHYSDDL